MVYIWRYDVQDFSNYKPTANYTHIYSFDSFNVSLQCCMPYFDSITEDIVAEQGSTANFEIQVYGWPLPDVHWSKDGTTLSSEERVR